MKYTSRPAYQMEKTCLASTTSKLAVRISAFFMVIMLLFFLTCTGANHSTPLLELPHLALCRQPWAVCLCDLFGPHNSIGAIIPRMHVVCTHNQPSPSVSCVQQEVKFTYSSIPLCSCSQVHKLANLGLSGVGGFYKNVLIESEMLCVCTYVYVHMCVYMGI